MIYNLLTALFCILGMFILFCGCFVFCSIALYFDPFFREERRKSKEESKKFDSSLL